MSKLTKREALENCIRHWTYIAENDVTKKEAFETLWVNRDRPKALCWCCEYNYQQDPRTTRMGCAECPIDAWRVFNGKPACLQKDSPYALWDTTIPTRDERKVLALAIVELAKESLTNLKENEDGSPS